MTKTMCFYISGRVQGVSFRMWTKRQADKHGLTGWVRNLRDNRVEGMVSGEREQLDLFVTFLHQGPILARVSGVEVNEVDYQDFPDFRVR